MELSTDWDFVEILVYCVMNMHLCLFDIKLLTEYYIVLKVIVKRALTCEVLYVLVILCTSSVNSDIQEH